MHIDLNTTSKLHVFTVSSTVWTESLRKRTVSHKLMLMNTLLGPILHPFDYSNISQPRYIVVKPDGVYFSFHFFVVWCEMRMNLKAQMIYIYTAKCHKATSVWGLNRSKVLWSNALTTIYNTMKSIYLHQMEIISTLFNVETHFGTFAAIFGCQDHCAVHYLS